MDPMRRFVVLKLWPKVTTRTTTARGMMQDPEHTVPSKSVPPPCDAFSNAHSVGQLLCEILLLGCHFSPCDRNKRLFRLRIRCLDRLISRCDNASGWLCCRHWRHDDRLGQSWQVECRIVQPFVSREECHRLVLPDQSWERQDPSQRNHSEQTTHGSASDGRTGAEREKEMGKAKVNRTNAFCCRCCRCCRCCCEVLVTRGLSICPFTCLPTCSVYPFRTGSPALLPTWVAICKPQHGPRCYLVRRRDPFAVRNGPP